MTLLSNNCDVGTDDTNVTSGNSGGGNGDAFTLSRSNDAGLKYSAAAAIHGTLGYLLAYVANAAAQYWWHTLPAAASVAGSCSVRRNDPGGATGTVPIAGTHTGASGGWGVQLRINRSTGAVTVHNRTGATIGTLGAAIPNDGTEWRVEFSSTKGTSTTTPDGVIRARVYADDTTPPAATVYSGVDTGTADFTQVRYGVVQSMGADLGMHFDSHRSQDSSALYGNWVTNQAPTCDAGTAQTVAQGATVNLAGTASDPDGSIASRAWTFDEYPGSSAPSLTGGTTLTPSFTAADYGRYVLRLTVTDNNGATAEDTVDVYVPTSSEVLPIRDSAGSSSSVGTWTNVGGASAKGAATSDSSDATYVESADVTGTETSQRLRMRPSVRRSSATLTVRAQKSTSDAVTCTVRLLEGATVRKSWTITLTTSWADFALALSAAEAATIGDWNNLFVETAAVI